MGNEPRLAKRIDVHSLNAIGLRLRSDTVSVFNGPPPTIASLKDEAEEIKTVANWLRERAKAGVLPHELGIFVRSEGQLERARAAAQEAQMAFRLLDEKVETTTGYMSIGTMHLAKGLDSGRYSRVQG
ncbi:MAG: hypothetical protein WAN75_42470 [Xanthobacteraceae bacterium]